MLTEKEHHITTKPIYIKDILTNKIIKIDLTKKPTKQELLKSKLLQKFLQDCYDGAEVKGCELE